MGQRAIVVVAFATILMGCGKNTNSSLEKENENEAGQYIVVFKNNHVLSAASSRRGVVSQAKLVQGVVQTLGERYGVSAIKKFHRTIKAGVYRLSKDQVRELEVDPSVAYVEKDHIVSVNSFQSDPPWGLDRIDQQQLPLDHSYESLGAQAGVNAYVIDTGVLASHEDFEGRAFHGVDIVDGDTDSTDCNGHGTHVAGTVGSSTFGVAKDVNIIGVRVLDCFGSGSYSDVIAGVEWVTENHVAPAVANMSLGGPISQALSEAIEIAIAAGVTFVVAAGNSNRSACTSSPANLDSTITVASTTSSDARSSFSNYGECVDIFAPGSDIESTWSTADDAVRTISGTSMASPHVAGVAALYLSQNPSALPEDVKLALLEGSSIGLVTDEGTDSPNLLINTQFLLSDDDGDDGDEDVEGVLRNNVAVHDLSAEDGEFVMYQISVPAGVVDLSFEMAGGLGDADIYVKYGSEPGLSDYDCRPYDWGNDESCSFNSPRSGTWYVMVRAYSAYSGVSLVASY